VIAGIGGMPNGLRRTRVVVSGGLGEHDGEQKTEQTMTSWCAWDCKGVHEVENLPAWP